MGTVRIEVVEMLVMFGMLPTDGFLECRQGAGAGISFPVDFFSDAPRKVVICLCGGKLPTFVLIWLSFFDLVQGNRSMRLDC